MSRSIERYGSWSSPVSAQSLIEGVVGLSDLRSSSDGLFWLESRPEESGRTTLMTLQGGRCTELTPPPYSVRSRVHEYGGGAYAVAEDGIFFVNFQDQNLYGIAQNGKIRQITSSDAGVRFADFVIDADGGRIICVVEQHQPDREPENSIAAIDISTGKLQKLASGHDFYACPRLSPTGQRLAFIAWDHPNMPWDGTVLQVAGFSDDGSLIDIATLAGGAVESVLQPAWRTETALLFISDTNGFWNLYQFDESGIYCVLEDGADYADPPWGFGMRSYTALDDDHVLIRRHTDAREELVLINTRTTMATPFIGDEGDWLHFGSPCVQGDALYFIGSYADRSPTIERLPLKGGASTTIRESGGPSLALEDLSRGEPITFPTRDGLNAHGFFYGPKNAAFDGPEGDRPPLLVISHGGPTGATSASLSLRIQYYTTRGWAVLDVNYRGSTGYGRAYRQALNGQWGILDVSDCEDGVRHLIRSGRVDPDRVAIRGGSAGGYTTLAALTSTDSFKAGASHYGIGDLNALASDTHKFESRYLHSLLGDPSMLAERSPINHLDRFRCPVIFFQGSEDKVVPPNQSQSMAEAVRAKGIPVAYVEFEGEGHGFRDSANIIQAVESEYGFFCRVFDIIPADNLPAIAIDNASSL